MKKTRRDVLVVGLTGGWSGRIVGLVLGCNCIRNLLCICNLPKYLFYHDKSRVLEAVIDIRRDDIIDFFLSVLWYVEALFNID